MICYADRHKHKSRRLCKLFADGCDGKVVYDAASPQGTPAFFYGVTPRQVDLFTKVRASGDWYFCDNAYAPCPAKPNGQPMELFRITREAAQADGTGTGDHYRRVLYMPPVLPWKRGGRDILVCLQSADHHALWGEPRDAWLRRSLRTLRAHTGRPVVIRDKPLRSPATEPFEQALSTAWAVVTWNSRVAIEAILSGVPAFVGTRCAASPMAGDDLTKIETPPRPEGREEWAAVLANSQWTVPEIISGYAWRALQER
jgi:hypothetical protein